MNERPEITIAIRCDVADPAGVAAIMTLVDMLARNPHIRHGTIRIGFTPDEEIGVGIDSFDVDRFGAISVVVTAVHLTKGKAAELRTSFTIKGVTAAVPLPVVISELDDGSIRIVGETKLDRGRFDLGWNRLGMVSSTATVAADAIFVRVSR